MTAYSAADNSTGPTPLASDIPEVVKSMSPMYHLRRRDAEVAPHWWIRLGTKDTDTALTVSSNLAAEVAATGAGVDHIMYWDEGHGANTDAADFISWIGRIAE
ncbi:hypothetical protein [Mycolicibacterium baixiangningiae]|uniref:hypothetical protein n=1 Tax=Mycolicibacterium baixiangningiae TaxID=2761578 RepID=UPI001867DB1B|nr:hypothetical protein [Mycolicibacterium baixiangningiae]